MSESSDITDAEQLRRARLEARFFRARGELVYPGRLVVLRAGSFLTHPVDDDAFDLPTERIMGIAIWGAFAQCKPGMALVEEEPARKFAAIIAGETRRPSTGVGRIDAWIARADALRKLRSGGVAAPGGIPLTRNQLIASVGEIESVVRESAIALIENCPCDQRAALLALARVADTQHPQQDELTPAILELNATAPAWKCSARSVSVERGSGDRAHPALGGSLDTDLSEAHRKTSNPPPAAVSTIDEYDAAILAFLNQTPSLRRRVSDVLPEKGPQDRKAVGARLRKLAARTPPLVDFPRAGRSGVAILPAGVEALKRATAPMPH